MEERVFLRGENVILRALEESDADGAYLHWFDDEEVCRHNSHHRFPFQKRELLDYIESQRGNRRALVLAVVDRASGSHIGNVSLQEIDYINSNAELAIIVGEKEYWGRGLSTEAARLIIGHAFDALNLHRICLGTSVHNAGMIGLAKKLGFLEEGRQREALYKNGSYVDLLQFGLLRDMWART